MRDHLLRALPAVAGCALFAGTASAQFSQDTTNIPNEGSSSENIDFGDVDLDGDWDVAVADGGDNGNDQNRIWINLGGLQGGTVGDYQDQTGARLPVLSDDSRDIEFADIDDDGDLDIYVSNTAQISNQGNRWWMNSGGAQGGTLGNYTDETAARWVGLNSASSSVPTQLLIPDAIAPETFIDWSCDCDFGDLDNDGDLDLFHSTYGGAFGGNVPSRIFLNDAGFFEEFNPSGFKMTNTNVQQGQPGLWCEGTQQNETSISDGSRCDIASSALDIDIGDLDGDLDLDILHGSRQTDTRLFYNRLEETGTLAFRDVSAAKFPANWASGGNNYEQEIGDVDNDNDLDIYGLNWQGFNDNLFLNDGTGTFGNKTTLPGSGADDNEGDFLDYDNDGDLDLFVANFSGSNKLYRNQSMETGSVNYVIQQQGLGGGTSLDADCADYDGDGDTDIIIAQDNFATNEALTNNGVADTWPASLDKLEGITGHAASKADDVVRVQVYDNAPYYITWYNPTSLAINVDGIDFPALPMISSGGQIFRAEVPGNLVGDVTYSASSTDEQGNTGVSSSQSYTNTGPNGFNTGSSTPSSVGTPKVISASRAFAGEQLYLYTEGVAPGSAGLLVIGNATTSLNLGDGILLNVDPAGSIFDVLVLPVADSNGNTTLVVEEAGGPALAGTNLFLQYLAADGASSTWASSRALSLTFQ